MVLIFRFMYFVSVYSTNRTLISISYKIICQISGPKIMVDRDEIRDRLETNLPFCRLPRALAVVQRRRADIIKQWSIDDTQSWFYSRSESLDRHHQRPGHFSEESSEKACSKIPKIFDRIYSRVFSLFPICRKKL